MVNSSSASFASWLLLSFSEFSNERLRYHPILPSPALPLGFRHSPLSGENWAPGDGVLRRQAFACRQGVLLCNLPLRHWWWRQWLRTQRSRWANNLDDACLPLRSWKDPTYNGSFGYYCCCHCRRFTLFLMQNVSSGFKREQVGTESANNPVRLIGRRHRLRRLTAETFSFRSHNGYGCWLVAASRLRWFALPPCKINPERNLKSAAMLSLGTETGCWFDPMEGLRRQYGIVRNHKKTWRYVHMAHCTWLRICIVSSYLAVPLSLLLLLLFWSTDDSRLELHC